MLFETLSQPKIFATLAMLGFVSGFVFDASNYIVFLCKKNKVVKIVFDFLATCLCFALFFVATLKLDFGTTRLYHIFAFCFALGLQRKMLGNVIAKLFDRCYNLFTNALQKVLKGARKKKRYENVSTNKPNNTV